MVMLSAPPPPAIVRLASDERVSPCVGSPVVSTALPLTAESVNTSLAGPTTVLVPPLGSGTSWETWPPTTERKSPLSPPPVRASLPSPTCQKKVSLPEPPSRVSSPPSPAR